MPDAICSISEKSNGSSAPLDEPACAEKAQKKKKKKKSFQKKSKGDRTCEQSKRNQLKLRELCNIPLELTSHESKSTFTSGISRLRLTANTKQASQSTRVNHLPFKTINKN
jgi:hypothetical protein